MIRGRKGGHAVRSIASSRRRAFSAGAEATLFSAALTSAVSGDRIAVSETRQRHPTVPFTPVRGHELACQG